MLQSTESSLFYQFSMTHVLEGGIYDGDLTIAELKKHGDFGLGTFNGFDGEMVALEGQFFQIDADGTARGCLPVQKVPFASVLFFKPTDAYEIGSISAVEEVSSTLARYLDPKLVHAIRIDGEFQWVRARGVPKQTKPYQSIEEVAKQRTILERRSVKGSMVGFRCPEAMRGLNVPGYHLHFIDEERTWGGHLLDCSGRQLTAQVTSTCKLCVELSLSDGETDRCKTRE